jgi:AraC-like DNA-binding protein
METQLFIPPSKKIPVRAVLTNHPFRENAPPDVPANKKTGQWHELAQRSKYCAADVALELGISRRQLQRRTQAAFGGHPRDWLMQERLAAAAESLKMLCSVKCVAFEFGFKRVSHFCREFKLRYGLTPTAFVAGSAQGLADSPQTINGPASSKCRG